MDLNNIIQEHKLTSLGAIFGILTIFSVLMFSDINVPILDNIIEFRIWVMFLILAVFCSFGGIPDDLPIFKLSLPAITLILVCVVELYRLVEFEVFYEKILTWVVMGGVVLSFFGYLGLKR